MLKSNEKQFIFVSGSDPCAGHVIIFGSTRAVYSEPMYDYQKSKDEPEGECGANHVTAEQFDQKLERSVK